MRKYRTREGGSRTQEDMKSTEGFTIRKADEPSDYSLNSVLLPNPGKLVGKASDKTDTTEELGPRSSESLPFPSTK